MSEQITHYTPCCATCRHAEAGGPCAWRHDNADGDCCPDWEYGNHAAWLGDDTPYPMASREITAEPHGSMEEHTALCEHTRVESLPDRRKQLPHHVMVLHSQKGLLAAAALAYRYGKELHPAGTAAKLQELAKERDEAEVVRREWRLNGVLHREDGPAIEGPNGYREWLLHGKLHREDGPAIEWPGGYQSWWLHGKRHREDGPAIEGPNGYREWWLHGKRQPEPEPEPTLTESADGRREWWLNGVPHREDGPAIEWPDGRREWLLNGKRHRDDGPAIEWPDGRREWWLHGKRHRDDGPAIELPDGRREWWLNGVRHREDGPAIEWPDGYRSWWLNGVRQPEPDKGGRQ